MSVVVCTRDRPEQLESCLRRLAMLRYEEFEVVIVDNAPRDDAVCRRFVEIVGKDDRFRYVVEREPGLSNARNCGIAAARHAIIAFTDDDALVDADWLAGLALGFSRDPETVCVTGLVPAAELESPAQQYFDRRNGWASHLAPRIFDLGKHRDPSPVYPLAGVLGTGANFALERAFVMDIGGFDPVLGAGTPTAGGEDRDLFYRVLFRGRSIVFEPSAIVWHVHRTTDRDLTSQLFSWGTGLSAALTKQITTSSGRREVRRRFAKGALHALHLVGKGHPNDRRELRRRPRFVVAEMVGMLVGPFLYARACWARRKSVGSRHGRETAQMAGTASADTGTIAQ
jgi:glycosyltransferase involved in cell wall biosynthesis